MYLRSMSHLCNILQREENKNLRCYCSYLISYSENMVDLLAEKEKSNVNLAFKESKEGVYLQNLTLQEVNDIE